MNAGRIVPILLIITHRYRCRLFIYCSSHEFYLESSPVTMRHSMTTLPPSRNPFADPALPTFADLIDRLKRDRELPKAKRQNWVWAPKTVMRAAAADPAKVLVHPQFVRTLMQRAAPESIGLSRASWNNARSLMGKILEWAGLAKMPAHYLAPFAPAWGALRVSVL